MKKLILIASLLCGAFQAQAEPLGYHVLLVEQDIVRTFWSPCSTSQLGDVETEEIANYESQGFVLVAKILMPQLDSRARIPECQYTFVRRTNLK